MNSPQVKVFIKEKSNLFWDIPEEKKEEISLDRLVETILNYGTLDDVRKLLSILGIQETFQIFKNAEGRKKLNYFPEIHYFFSLYFSRYA